VKSNLLVISYFRGRSNDKEVNLSNVFVQLLISVAFNQLVRLHSIRIHGPAGKQPELLANLNNIDACVEYLQLLPFFGIIYLVTASQWCAKV